MHATPRDGMVIFVKRECETCQMVEPVLAQLARSMPTLVFTQDDPSFPAIGAIDDTSLEQSFALDIEAVPTVLRFEDGKEVARTHGWERAQWEKVTGLAGLGPDLPAMGPGCGSK